MPVSDVIERELVLKSARSRVWAAITTPEGLSHWWGNSAEVDLRPGGRIQWDFGETYGINHGTVVEVQPEERFVLTWCPFMNEPGAEEVPDLTTRIEFRLEDHPDGTLLKLRESGFAALPAALAARTLENNQSGWDEVLEQLRRYVTGEVAHPV